MYCKNCGIELENGAKFCANCGTEQDVSEVTAEAAYVANQNIEPTALEAEPVVEIKEEAPNTKTDPPLIAGIKKVLGSKLFLVAAILLTVGTVLSIFYSVANPLSAEDIKIAIDDFGVLEDLEGTFSKETIDDFLKSDNGTFFLDLLNFFDVITYIIPILSVVGVWIFFSACQKKSGAISTSGLKMIQVLETINMVEIFVAAGLMLLLAICSSWVTMLIPEASQETKLVIFISVIILGVVFALLFAAAAVVEMFVIRGLKFARKTISGEASLKGTTFLIVFCFAVAAIEMPLIVGESVDVLAFLSDAATAAAHVIFGILLIKYKSAVKPFVKPFYEQHMPAEVVEE